MTAAVAVALLAGGAGEGAGAGEEAGAAPPEAAPASASPRVDALVASLARSTSLGPGATAATIGSLRLEPVALPVSFGTGRSVHAAMPFQTAFCVL